ncbi:YARHG domain-containing protein [Methylobacterium flocculans]|uniref:YARHG domain-containing protein n=1 Tax=Methylobacterium flocculans TaxID=2984843 RepID=UPI0021F35ACD|nr:YARHG domain-containing protein [Methylobacterium sp. FF17]
MRKSAFLALVLLSAGPARADFPCDALWAERNAVYADAGYCFRTPRGIKAFGNAGCRFDEIRDVPLSERKRQDVADILREERRNGCRD